MNNGEPRDGWKQQICILERSLLLRGGDGASAQAVVVIDDLSPWNLRSLENAPTPQPPGTAPPFQLATSKRDASLPSLPHLAFSVSQALSNQHRLA